MKKEEKQQLREEFREKFSIGIVVGLDDKPHQDCVMNNKGQCDFVRTQDIETFWLSIIDNLLDKEYKRGFLDGERQKRLKAIMNG